jgi:Fur family ferric uptake transcriptional regulator
MTHEDKDYIQALRSRGYRVTPQRLIVLDAVCAHQGHATLADIQAKVHDMDPTIDRSTIYRTLDVLREVGLIVESEVGETGKVYSVAGEADHHHLVCLSCGAVLTVDGDAIAPLLSHIRDAYGFEVQTDHLVFNGVCEVCRREE